MAGKKFEKNQKHYLTSLKKMEEPPDIYICVADKLCKRTFKSSKSLEKHILKKHETSEFAEVYKNEIFLSKNKSEFSRLKTFLKWPEYLEPIISSEDLANAGFVYKGKEIDDSEDNVQCVFCAGIIGSWESGDDPLLEHVKSFPNCGFVRGLDVGNIPIRDPVFDSISISSLDSSQEIPKIEEPCVYVIEDRLEQYIRKTDIVEIINPIDEMLNDFPKY